VAGAAHRRDYRPRARARQGGCRFSIVNDTLDYGQSSLIMVSTALEALRYHDLTGERP
jgi:hypothetical protein